MRLDELAGGLRGEVAADPETRDAYSRDASLFRVEPTAVAFPFDAADIGRLVSFVAARKAADPSLSLTARAAGTDMSGGPLTSSVVMDMTRHFNRVLSVDDDGRAVTQPGVFYRDFEAATLAKGWLLPSYPASRDLCTVGGMVANNSGGEKTLSYGKTDRYARRLRAVLSDGNEYEFRALSAAELEEKKALRTFEGRLYREMDALLAEHAARIEAARPRVSKNSAGYALWNVVDRAAGTFDLCQLLVGSQGTLGIVTEIEFDLVRPKRHARMLVVFLDDLAPLASVVERVLRHAPESVESYDDKTLGVALKVLPRLIRKMRGGVVRLALQFLPELRMALTGGIPKLVLMAEFTADEEADAEARARAAERGLAGSGLRTRVTRTEDEGQKYWTIRRESFNLLRQHAKHLRTAPFIDDFIVRPEDLSSFLPELYAILGRYDLTFTVAGHAGDANFHIIPLMDVARPGTTETIRRLYDEVYELVFRYHGSATGEHNDGLVRSPLLPRMYGDDVVRLFERTKRIFDPLCLFNPGKKAGMIDPDPFRHLDLPSAPASTDPS